jgi:hypothetical protein
LAIAGSAQLQSVMPPPLGEMTTQLISTAPPLIGTQAGIREATSAVAARRILMMPALVRPPGSGGKEIAKSRG